MYAAIKVGAPGELHLIEVFGSPWSGYTVKLDGEEHSHYETLGPAKADAKAWARAFAADIVTEAMEAYKAADRDSELVRGPEV